MYPTSVGHPCYGWSPLHLSLVNNIIGGPTCVLSSFIGRCQQRVVLPDRPKWVHLSTAFQRSVARRLNFRVPRINRGADKELFHPSLCPFTTESVSAFHVPAFQRNHSKKAGTFLSGTLWVQPCCPLPHYVRHSLAALTQYVHSVRYPLVHYVPSMSLRCAALRSAQCCPRFAALRSCPADTQRGPVAHAITLITLDYNRITSTNTLLVASQTWVAEGDGMIAIHSFIHTSKDTQSLNLLFTTLYSYSPHRQLYTCYARSATLFPTGQCKNYHRLTELSLYHRLCQHVFYVKSHVKSHDQHQVVPSSDCSSVLSSSSSPLLQLTVPTIVPATHVTVRLTLLPSLHLFLFPSLWLHLSQHASLMPP
jgi:hypothetical protein